LATLYCGNNPLNSIDVTQNTSLTVLSCSANQLNSLDVTQNTSLATLYCSGNQLSSLDVAQNASLATLYCSGNPLSSIDVTQNTSLKTLYCNSNQLSSLNVTQNTGLRTLHCNSNQLSSLDMTQNTSLRTLYCMNNQLTNLNVAQNTNLIELICQNNQLTSLDVKNGNNTIMTGFVSSNNSSLTCIQVDDSNYSTAYWINVDSTATFSTNCSVFNSINTITQEINPVAYPNPTTKEITLDFGKTYQEANIQITNLTGQTVLSRNLQNSSTVTLELEGTAGIYFVNIQTEEGATTVKIIKE
jgi:Leucine-rich repeat (LRR) protein